MRLWHKDLLPVLPRQQLLGQWRECVLIAKQIKEKGTPNHILVSKVIEYPISHLYAYGLFILGIAAGRGYHIDFGRFKKYFDESDYIGKCPTADKVFEGWHNNRYMIQCLCNLQEKYDCGAIPDDEWQKVVEKYPAWR